MYIRYLRKSFVLFLFSLPFISLWPQQIDNLRISGSFNQLPILLVFNQIETNYPVKFYFKEEWFAGDTVNIVLVNVSFEEAVRTLVNGSPFIYKIINNNKAVFLPREEVSALVGSLSDYSSNSGNSQSFIQIGTLGDEGKHKNVILSGQITDGITHEPIIGATIQINNLQLGAISNLQGDFKISLAPGIYTLFGSSVGYEKNQYNIKVVGDGVLNIELFNNSISLDDIIIYGERLDKNVSSNQMSIVELDIRSLKQLPLVSGGRDVLKGLTSMPGVKSVGEFSSGINVRGGGEDQNLYLINGAPLFNTSHVFGLFSVINPDAVEKLSLYKGHIPAIYGERVSSVVDIHTIETPPEKITVRGGIGLYDSRLMTLMPIYKDKIFLDLSGRTSYSNWLLKSMKDYNLSHSMASFYDINGSLHFAFPKNQISLSGYTCWDEFRFASEVDYAYGSTLGSVNWNSMINSSLGSYLTISYSNYRVTKDDISTELFQSRFKSGIQYLGLKYRMKYTGINHHTLVAGVSGNNYLIKPGNLSPLDTISLIDKLNLEPETAFEGALFINDEYTINQSFNVNVGLRLSGYKHPDQEMFYGIEPRLSTRIKLNDRSSIKLSYNRNFQYISIISPSSVSTPADIWKLSDQDIKPLIANQYALGYYQNFLNNSIETSVEVYYKNLSNVIEYVEGLVNSKGVNYGVEFLLKKNSGKVDGWISYTYSKSLRRTSGKYPSEIINYNNYFPSSFDKPHDLTIVANYHFNKRLKLSANFNYSSGRPITLPEHKYFISNEAVVVFSDRNEYRIPDYHRFDISITYDESLRIKKKWKGSWAFSLLNVYGRKNPYTIFYKAETPNFSNDYNPFSMYKLYLIGKPVPTLTYSFIF
jgi:hypothetical protein